MPCKERYKYIILSMELVRNLDLNTNPVFPQFFAEEYELIRRFYTDLHFE